MTQPCTELGDRFLRLLEATPASQVAWSALLGARPACLAPSSFAGAHSSLESLPSSPDSPAEALDWLSLGLRALGLRNEECVELRLCICEDSGLTANICACLVSLSFHYPEATKVLLMGMMWFCTGFPPLFMCWPLLSMAASAVKQRHHYPKEVIYSASLFLKAQSQEEVSQLSTSAVQASVVSGMAIVCLQAIPKCLFKKSYSLQ